MPDCATCSLFGLETEGSTCLHVNRPGGLALTEQALNLCDLAVGSQVLDVASGASTTLNYLVNKRKLNAIGLDLSNRMLQLGRDRNTKLRLIQADCGRIPLANSSQQAVLMECALSLAGNFSDTLCEYQRILTPGGQLLLTDVYIREILDPTGMGCLATTHCLAGVKTAEVIQNEVLTNGFKIQIWQDQTVLFMQWMAGMVFKLGSLNAFYRNLVSGDEEVESLDMALGKKIKLGYYLLIAKKRA